MSDRSDTNRWLPEDAALEVLETSRGAGRELLGQGLLRPTQDGIFRDADIAEATILQHVRPLLGRISTARNTWAALRDEGTIDALVEVALSDQAALRFELVFDELTREVVGAVDDGQLLAAIRGPLRRRIVFLDLTQELNSRLTAFRRRANQGPVPATRRGRPRKSAEIHQLPTAAIIAKPA
jgi:hypothetical protein